MRAIPTENMVKVISVIRSIHPYRFSSVLRRAPLIIVKFNISPRIINYEIKYLFILSYINDSLKPLLLMSSMLSSDSSNVDVELISYLAQSAIVLAVNAQASLSRVRLNNIAKEIYGSEVLLPIKIKGNSSNSKSSSGSNGRSTAPRIFTMLLRPVLRMLRDINVSVIAYLDDLLIVGSTKEECLSNLKKTMDLLVKLGFKLNLEKSVLEPTQPITFLGLLDKPEPSNVQLLNNQNECTPPRLESMEAMSGLPTTHSFAFYPGEDELIQFEEGFYNTDLPNLEISNLVSDDSSTSSSSSSSYVSSSTGNIPRSIDQTISRVNTNPNSTTLETGDYSTFQSHVMSIIRIQKSSTAELLMKSCVKYFDTLRSSGMKNRKLKM
ncbi:hypothetical protein ACTFIW_005513 [Dictyostelium discoideum]